MSTGKAGSIETGVRKEVLRPQASLIGIKDYVTLGDMKSGKHVW